jgi:hypothetical protein
MAEKKDTHPVPQVKAEKLLTLRALVPFSDGNLREFFEQYGYTVDWQANEVRKIPAWLMLRCTQSGAELERSDG